MLLHIALVSITKEVTLAHLAPVSAAIQKQISRDFGPMWNVEATVDALDKLEDVPIGYWHVLLQDELPNGAAGLHIRDDNKQPFALVALTTNWPVFTEILQMNPKPASTSNRRRQLSFATSRSPLRTVSWSLNDGTKSRSL